MRDCGMDLHSAPSFGRLEPQDVEKFYAMPSLRVIIDSDGDDSDYDDVHVAPPTLDNALVEPGPAEGVAETPQNNTASTTSSNKSADPAFFHAVYADQAGAAQQAALSRGDEQKKSPANSTSPDDSLQFLKPGAPASSGARHGAGAEQDAMERQNEQHFHPGARSSKTKRRARDSSQDADEPRVIVEGSWSRQERASKRRRLESRDHAEGWEQDSGSGEAPLPPLQIVLPNMLTYSQRMEYETINLPSTAPPYDYLAPAGDPHNEELGPAAATKASFSGSTSSSGAVVVNQSQSDRRGSRKRKANASEVVVSADSSDSCASRTSAMCIGLTPVPQ